jgi:uncharacterized protein (DUF362 family)
MSLSRRRFFQLAGSGLLLQSPLLKAQQTRVVASSAATTFSVASKAALVHGEDRRKNVCQALVSIDDQVRAGLRHKKCVVIKPNGVNSRNQLASTHVDALNGILDYLESRFHGPVVIAESSADDTLEVFENWKYNELIKQRRAQKISLIDLNREAKYETMHLVDYDLHITPVRLAARLLDPDAYVICCSMLKTHNTIVATMSVKNMVLGAPLRSNPGETKWNDKRKYHVGIRQTHYNMLLTAQKLQPHWGAAVIDGFEGMEGEGPNAGKAVPSHIAIASTDYIAADRVGLEVMGINPDWVGYLRYCGQAGLGQYDLSKIEVIGSTIASVEKKYELHKDIERELKWMGPMNELPQSLGSLRESHEFIYG